MDFSRQEYWTELPFPSPEDLPDPGIKPTLFSFQVDGVELESGFFVCLFLCFVLFCLGRGGGCLFPMVELP